MLKRLENLLLAAAAMAVLAMGVMITVNVILRLAGNSLPDSVVIVQELMIVAIVLPLAAVTAARAHISVEVLTARLPERVQRALLPLGWIVGLVALIPLGWRGWTEFLSAWQGGSFYFGDLSVPKWPGLLCFALGIAVCCLRLLWILLEDLGIVRGREK